MCSIEAYRSNTRICVERRRRAAFFLSRCFPLLVSPSLSYAYENFQVDRLTFDTQNFKSWQKFWERGPSRTECLPLEVPCMPIATRTIKITQISSNLLNLSSYSERDLLGRNCLSSTCPRARNRLTSTWRLLSNTARSFLVRQCGLALDLLFITLIFMVLLMHPAGLVVRVRLPASAVGVSKQFFSCSKNPV